MDRERFLLLTDDLPPVLRYENVFAFGAVSGHGFSLASAVPDP